MSGYESPSPEDETTGADRPGTGAAHADEHTPAEASTPTYESAQDELDAAESGLTAAESDGTDLQN